MNNYELIGAQYRQGSPTIRASRPGQEYQPRQDQIEAVMKKNRQMTAAEARVMCQQNHATWRDEIRKWKWMQTGYGTYVQVEDR